MKIYILTLLSIAVLFSSCVDKDPENALPITKVDYTKTENMFEPVAGVYSYANESMSHWVTTAILSIRTGDVDKGSTSADQGELEYCKNFNYSIISNYHALNATWKNLYELIQYCNSALISLDNYGEYATGANAKALNAQYKAEVRFIRAYAFFFITRLWGDVPLLTDNNALINGYLGKSPRKDIYAFIITEMEDAAQDMPALRPNEMPYKGQVTKYTALALKAKACTDINDWDGVLDATNEIINSNKFILFPDYYSYWKKAGCLSDENLFELQFASMGATSNESYTTDWAVFQGPRNGFEGGKIGSGWGFLTPNNNLVNFFTNRNDSIRYKTDLLFTGTVTLDGDIVSAATTANPSKVYSGKAYLPGKDMQEGHTKYGDGNNVRMLRYADILLLNAEAKVRKGAPGDGDTSLNLVRNRVKLNGLTNATVDQILEERHAELALEWGERFYDLVRTGKAASVLPGFKVGQSEFYPLPQAQLDLNPSL